MKKAKTVDEYFKALNSVQIKAAEAVRNIFLKTVPELEESISYDMPAYKLHGKRFMYFAVFEKHLGFYPLPDIIETFRNELSKYKTGKGSIQFPLDKPMPTGLIERMIKTRMKDVENEPSEGNSN